MEYKAIRSIYDKGRELNETTSYTVSEDNSKIMAVTTCIYGEK